MRKHFMSYTLFVATACVALAVNYCLFEVSNGWYGSPIACHFTTLVQGSSLAAILMMWTLFPSRLAVGLIALGTQLFTVLLHVDAQHAMRARNIDLQGAGLMALGVLLLVLATHFRIATRRRDRKIFAGK